MNTKNSKDRPIMSKTTKKTARRNARIAAKTSCPKGLLQGLMQGCRGCPKGCCKRTEAAHCPKGVARARKLPKRLAARAAARKKKSMPKALLQGTQRLPTAQKACCKDSCKNYCNDSTLLKKLVAMNCKDTEAAQKAC